jgi:hypothetical protein
LPILNGVAKVLEFDDAGSVVEPEVIHVKPMFVPGVFSGIQHFSKDNI